MARSLTSMSTLGAGMAATAALLAVPVTASAAVPPNIQGLIDSGVISDGTRPDNTQDWYPGLPAIVIITPGTDDTSLLDRTAGLSGTRTTYVVQYPESVGPIISGKSGALLPFFAPSYDKSKEKAVQGNLAVFRALNDNPPGVLVIFNGYSQGADALGNAVEEAYAEGVIPPGVLVVLMSDPRGPWGVKQWVASQPLLPELLGVIGVKSDGARDPGATGDTAVTSVILTGDPVANWQWQPLRPISSLAVNAAGFLTVHSGRGPQHYGTITSLGPSTTYLSDDGATMYSVFKTAHPFALATAALYDSLGIEYTADDLAEWDAAWQKFYKISEPTPGNAAVPIHGLSTVPVSSSSYSVTMPSEVATGQEPAAATPTVLPEVPVTATPVEPAPDTTAISDSENNVTEPEPEPSPVVTNDPLAVSDSDVDSSNPESPGQVTPETPDTSDADDSSATDATDSSVSSEPTAQE